MAGMMKPNWFDDEFEPTFKQVNGKEVLEKIAKNQKVIKAIDDALKTHDDLAKKSGYAGPSRTQVIRKAIAEVLQAD